MQEALAAKRAAAGAPPPERQRTWGDERERVHRCYAAHLDMGVVQATERAHAADLAEFARLRAQAAGGADVECELDAFFARTGSDEDSWAEAANHEFVKKADFTAFEVRYGRVVARHAAALARSWGEAVVRTMGATPFADRARAAANEEPF